MTVRRVGIIGSGTMGSGITEVVAKAGFEVILRSRSRDGCEAMQAALERSLDRQVSRRRLADDARGAVLALVRSTTSLDDLAGCDLVVESVVEDLEVKKQLFAALDAVCAADTILATNTSTLPVVEMAAATARPERVCGIHFFNPAAVMALVEVVRPLTASDATMAAARAFVEACGKQPIEVTDTAGFIVNALLFPYLNDAVRLLERGVAGKEDIDAAMRGGANFAMGPFALMDLVGLDVTVAILDALYRENPDPFLQAAPLLRRMVTAGRLGRKSGRGFYDYASTTPAAPSPP